MGLVGRSAGLEEAEMASSAAGRDLRSTATENPVLPFSKGTWNQVLAQSLRVGGHPRQDLERETPRIKLNRGHPDF